MRQSILEATYLVKPKYTSYRRNRNVLLEEKKEENVVSTTNTTSETHFSNFHTAPANSSQIQEDHSVQHVSSQGSLIIIPPQFTRFVRSNINNPAYIRKVVGEHYWNKLYLNDVCNNK